MRSLQFTMNDQFSTNNVVLRAIDKLSNVNLLQTEKCKLKITSRGNT